MSDITLSKAVRSNLLNLQSTATQLGKTQERLATGQRVNSALDNPTNFFTASSLNSRASDMSQLLDSMSNGIQTIEAADNGLSAITKTLESMQSTLTQARQDKSFKATSYDLDSTAIGTSTLKNLSFSGGSVGTQVDVALNTMGTATQSTVTGVGAYVPPTAATQASLSATADYVAPTAATQSVVTAASTYTNIDLTNNADNEFAFSVNLGGTSASITLTQALASGNTSAGVYNIDEAISAIQTQIDASAIGAGAVTVGKDVAGTSLTFTAVAAGATALTVSGVTSTGTGNATAVSALGISDAATTGQTNTGADAVDRVITISDGANTSNITLTSANASTAADARTVITAALASDGVNLTVGGTGNRIDLTGAADGTNSITIGGAGADSVFGAGAQAGATAGVAAQDRVFTISTDGGTTSETITLTSANAATASAAKTVIDAAIAASSVLTGAITSSVDGTNVISLAGAADGSNSITVGGANVNDVFGGAPTPVAGSTGTAGEVKSVDQLVESINTNSSLTGKIRASNDNGKLRIENLSTQDLTVAGWSSSAAKIDGSTGTTTIGGNTVRADLATQYNTLRDQLDKLSDDASFNGVNLLRGDQLQITFNETSTSEISIQAKGGKSVNSANLGLQTSLQSENLDSDANIDSYIGLVKDALGSVRSQASSFGSNLSVVQNRQDFTKNMINTLQTGASNLTLADSNEEAANLLALQTRQQLSSTALSLASQSDQNVLRLF